MMVFRFLNQGKLEGWVDKAVENFMFYRIRSWMDASPLQQKLGWVIGINHLFM